VERQEGVVTGRLRYFYQDGHLRTVTATPNGSGEQVVVDTLRYQPFGPLASLRYGNGLQRAQQFDTDGRLTSNEVLGTTGGLVQGLEYSWNANNEITGLANARNPQLSQSYGYDALGRLTGAGRGDGRSEAFGYDAVGNRSTYGMTGQTTLTHAYSSSSQRLLSSSAPRLWTYDGNGNSTGYTGAGGVAVGLHYDAFARVDASSRHQVTTAYRVNGLGQRVSKAGPNGTTQFIYAPDGSLLAERNGTQWTDYVRGNGEVLGLMQIVRPIAGSPGRRTRAVTLRAALLMRVAHERVASAADRRCRHRCWRADLHAH
jgi:YD repeat-containing protein